MTMIRPSKKFHRALEYKVEISSIILRDLLYISQEVESELEKLLEFVERNTIYSLDRKGRDHDSISCPRYNSSYQI